MLLGTLSEAQVLAVPAPSPLVLLVIGLPVRAGLGHAAGMAGVRISCAPTRGIETAIATGEKKPAPSGTGFSGQDGNAVRRESIIAV